MVVASDPGAADYHPPALYFQFEPVRAPAETTVAFELATVGFTREEQVEAGDRFLSVRSQTHPWLSPWFGWESLTHLYGLTPATDLAYRWLAEDLKSVGLLK